MTSRSAQVIGVPTSAGAFAPGQEQAPAALRAAGFIEALVRAGLVVRDDGDCATWRWRPDRENRRAQNLPQIVAIVRDTAERVAAAANELTLVLGGDCTVGIGTVAGHARHGRVGLVYFDLHADLNVPSSVLPGALDWMGMAHMLGEDGAAPELAGVAGCVPLLAPAQVVLFGWGPEQAQPRERDAIGRLHLPVISIDEVSADPHGAAVRASPCSNPPNACSFNSIPTSLTSAIRRYRKTPAATRDSPTPPQCRRSRSCSLRPSCAASPSPN